MWRTGPPHGGGTVARSHRGAWDRANWVQAPLRRRHRRHRGGVGHPRAQHPGCAQGAHGRAQHALWSGHGVGKSGATSDHTVSLCARAAPAASRHTPTAAACFAAHRHAGPPLRLNGRAGMGSKLSRQVRAYMKRNERRCLLVGLDSAGKSSAWAGGFGRWPGPGAGASEGSLRWPGPHRTRLPLPTPCSGPLPAPRGQKLSGGDPAHRGVQRGDRAYRQAHAQHVGTSRTGHPSAPAAAAFPAECSTRLTRVRPLRMSADRTACVRIGGTTSPAPRFGPARRARFLRTTRDGLCGTAPRAQGVIFVVDSADRARLELAREEFAAAVTDGQLEVRRRPRGRCCSQGPAPQMYPCMGGVPAALCPRDSAPRPRPLSGRRCARPRQQAGPPGSHVPRRARRCAGLGGVRGRGARSPHFHLCPVPTLRHARTLTRDAVAARRVCAAHHWHVAPCVATSGEGLWEGMNWLCQHMRPV